MTLAYRDVTRAVTESAPSHLSETPNSEACLGPLVDLESELSAPADWSIETKAFTLNAWAENAAIGDMERVFRYRRVAKKSNLARSRGTLH